MGRYRYYQPNNKDLKDEYGDCTIRALCKALGITWTEAFEKCIGFMREEQCLLSGMTLKQYKKVYGAFGFEYYGISNKKGTKRPTVESFAKNHKRGTYILNIANHQVAVVDGYYYDTWDCGEKSLYGYFEKKQEGQAYE